MALSKNELIKAINEMTFYEKDYDTIVTLLNNTSEKLFTKIVEEVALGNLYWSDFDRMLENIGYSEALRTNLELQNDLWDSVNRLATLRESLVPDYDQDAEMYDSMALIPKAQPAKYANSTELYNTELENYRSNILYNLAKVSRNDSILVRACKTRLYNSIRNGEILGYSATYTETAEDGTTQTYEAVSPADIFLFLDDYALPLDYEHQQLTAYDKMFMDQYRLTEKETKKLKALSMFLKTASTLSKDKATISAEGGS